MALPLLTLFSVDFKLLVRAHCHLVAISLLYKKECFNCLIRKEFFFQSSLLQKRNYNIGCVLLDSVTFVHDPLRN